MTETITTLTHFPDSGTVVNRHGQPNWGHRDGDAVLVGFYPFTATCRSCDQTITQAGPRREWVIDGEARCRPALTDAIATWCVAYLTRTSPAVPLANIFEMFDRWDTDEIAWALRAMRDEGWEELDLSADRDHGLDIPYVDRYIRPTDLRANPLLAAMLAYVEVVADTTTDGRVPIATVKTMFGGFTSLAFAHAIEDLAEHGWRRAGMVVDGGWNAAYLYKI